MSTCAKSMTQILISISPHGIYNKPSHVLPKRSWQALEEWNEAHRSTDIMFPCFEQTNSSSFGLQKLWKYFLPTNDFFCNRIIEIPLIPAIPYRFQSFTMHIRIVEQVASCFLRKWRVTPSCISVWWMGGGGSVLQVAAWVVWTCCLHAN